MQLDFVGPTYTIKGGGRGACLCHLLHQCTTLRAQVHSSLSPRLEEERTQVMPWSCFCQVPTACSFYHTKYQHIGLQPE